MTRARYFEVATDQFGRPLAGVTVNVYQVGTVTPIAETIYSAASGVGTLTNPLTTGASGEIEFWLADPAEVDVKWSKVGTTSETHTVGVLGIGATGLPAAPNLEDVDVGDGFLLVATQDPESVDAEFRLQTQGTADGGDFTITFDGETTDPIPWNDAVPTGTVEPLLSIGVGNVTATGLITDALVIRFIGALGEQPIAVELLSADGSGLTGPDAPYGIDVLVEELGVTGGPRSWIWADA